jgi:hypothetical protein
MYPLLPFAPLPTNIEHAAHVTLVTGTVGRADCDLLDAERPHLEPGLIDTSGLRSCAEHVHLVRQIVRRAYPRHFIEEAKTKNRKQAGRQ